MRRAIAAVIALAVMGIPLAAGADGVCARMPCCAREQVRVTVGAATCCTVENCAVTPRQHDVNLSVAGDTKAMTLDAVTVPAILSAGIIDTDCFTSPPIPFSPPASKRLALLSILLI